MAKRLFAISALILLLSACATTEEEAPCVIEPNTDDPMMCTMEWNPVCGCDGRTYGNACTAAAAGVQRTTPGECGKEGDPAQ